MAKKDSTVTIAIIAAIVIISVAVIFGTDLLQSDARTMTMDGSYEESIAPDNVEVYFSISTSASTAQGAQDENAELTRAVIDAFKEAGYIDADITTEYYDIYPEYDWSEDRQELIGYVARHQMKVIDDNITKAGSIVDIAVGNGANEIDYVDFSLTQETEQTLKVSALSKASANAREKAEAVAEGLGLSIVKVISVSEGNIYYPPFRIAYAEDTASSGSGAIDLTPGDVDITASVMVEFEIA